jgi:O-antigen/teichoic acid export membrane protein
MDPQNRSTPHRGGKNGQNSFFGGAAILAAGILVVKLIGMFYKIPLVNIIGAQGNTDFTNAYNIYAVLLTVATAGLPVAVSKLVSEANALGRRNQVNRTFRLALVMFLSLGILSFLVMYFRADWLAGLMHDTKCAQAIRVLAPAVICVGCLSAFRGYTQGNRTMVPTSVSQIIEALCKLVVGLPLAYWMIKAGKAPEEAAAGAIAGVTVGTAMGLLYVAVRYFVTLDRTSPPPTDTPDRAGVIVRNILRIAIPITLSTSMVGIVTVIDSSLVQGQLQRVLLENPDSWNLYTNFVDFTPLQTALTAWKGTLSSGTSATLAALTQQADQALVQQTAGAALTSAQSAALTLRTTLEGVSRTLYGNYSGALNIYNLPTSLMAAITASVIPAVSGTLAQRDTKGAARISASALRVTALVAFPMGVGLFVMGRPVMQLLYPALESELAGPLLSTLGIATPFVCLMLVCNSILQAHGFVNIPVVVMVIGGVLKIVVNYTVVVMPQIGIYGAPTGNILCFGLCLILDLIIIARVIPRRPRYLPLFLKPAIASAIMGGAAWAVYGLLSRVTGNAISSLAAILVAVVVYGVLVIALRIIAKEDLALMPKGDKIARILHIR